MEMDCSGRASRLVLGRSLVRHLAYMLGELGFFFSEYACMPVSLNEKYSSLSFIHQA